MHGPVGQFITSRHKRGSHAVSVFCKVQSCVKFILTTEVSDVRLVVGWSVDTVSCNDLCCYGEVSGR